MDLLLNNLVSEQFVSPIWVSLKIAVIAGIIVVVTGTMAGRFFARKQFKGKAIAETILMLPMVLPPTVVGFFLIVIFGKNSWAGQAITWLFDRPIIFTWWAAVIAAIVVAFPLMYQSAKSGFLSVDKDIENAARVDGASDWKIFYLISIPLASKALITGSILSFARALGEFGATLMFAGNIPGETQTLPIAIYIAIDSGNMIMAWLWVIAIVAISFMMLLVVRVRE
ncbi:molybdate transport system permease protein [Cytobacillus horneckiae]|uniref:Molybdenum transport system permease n=1 Tax=Cytobacillus horneckiae TaxID=549687 RepID=A0A2N0ZDB9_9BACI|nr:molybdate ABC transporter permease subunit [Cytobacillus horneckiae]MBN6885438.1 molybdate ABC transporter permease subunit [Cytobacillus horneckiae]MEC1158756.1 molybdate ABC transporter permease subunit [Cytobacillus horneckiae]MED2937279.1 molybdate ABC transporter permease subunit [Cytobacillus horneckiae]PKG27502.1 molybdate ABC transporter permease subunit [Cytobacillus horneckiae]